LKYGLKEQRGNDRDMCAEQSDLCVIYGQTTQVTNITFFSVDLINELPMSHI